MVVLVLRTTLMEAEPGVMVPGVTVVTDTDRELATAPWNT